MIKEFKIEVHKRELSNKSSDMKNLRKETKIPGIFYSHNSKESIPLYVTKKDLNDAQKSGARIFNISVGKEKLNVILKSIQYHPVTDEILHIDLYGVDMNRAVTVSVAIILDGNAKGVVEEGGVLVQSLNELEIECLPLEIPDNISVNIEDLSIGDSIKVDDIVVDKKFYLKTDGNQTIASVTHAMKEEDLAPVAEEDGTFMEDGETSSEESSEESSSEDISKDDAGDNKENTEG